MFTTWSCWLLTKTPLLRGHGGPDGREGVGGGAGGGRLVPGGGVPARHPRPAPAPGVGDEPALAQHAATAAELVHLLLLEAELVDVPEPEQVEIKSKVQWTLTATDLLFCGSLAIRMHPVLLPITIYFSNQQYQ